MKLPSALLGLLGLAGSVCADPTWPSQIDELEEIMFQLTSFRARRFAGPVSPCSSEASGPGRVNAAEWLRTAFHDMATANTFFGNGGLDASLQYELRNTENLGPGLNTTLIFMSPFFSRRSSLSDLIALGVYTSVRSCGGPAVPFRAGRRDATIAGPPGVPQAQNTAFTFQQQFDRMGFTPAEMIQVTACGHTLGGVHSAQFPDIAPPASTVNTNGQLGLDTTVANFDNRVVTEYLSGNTTNPLVVGPSVRVNRHADFKVYNSDRNLTMQALADPEVFRDVCRTVLQKMIDVVPRGVTLTDPIVPYAVKPVNLQLTLTSGGSTLQFTGFIRVRTTVRPEDDISTVVINYKARDGSTNCGSSSCTIRTTVQGVSQGFDDTFAFFPITANIPASTGISSFTVTVNHVDGTSETFDNNGNEYPMDDAILIQYPQSCLRGTTGALTVVAAVRNDRVSQGARAFVSFKVPQTTSSVPGLRNATVVMERGSCVGRYTFFSANYTIEGGLAYESNLDVINGDRSDSFKSVNNIGGTCRAFANPAACQSGASSSSSSVSTRWDDLAELFGFYNLAKLRKFSVLHKLNAFLEFTAVDKFRLFHKFNVFDELGILNECAGFRQLDDFYSCHKPHVFKYTECYCGNYLASSSDEAPLEQCNMVCGGDDGQFCGAGHRLELYSTTSAPPFTLTSITPEPTAVHVEEVGKYDLVGCWTEAQGTRALGGRRTTSAEMTNELCAEFCDDYKYFGTEYSSECYCGNFVASGSSSAPLDECSMRCSGRRSEYCGAGHRLNLYMNPEAETQVPEQPAAAGEFVWLSCQTDQVSNRTLNGATLSSDDMTNEVCAEFCQEFEYFGTEYGRECFCGGSLPARSAEAPDTECSMLCGGSGMEFCGGPDRLSTYVKQEEVQR
ncbi:hypothetical protein S40288_01443 [Stachybotrys chartarum IBT 40288]|nr:hypothetical protein S40288_01443 [Stachybotrys chartarum IBT 40288]